MIHRVFLVAFCFVSVATCCADDAAKNTVVVMGMIHGKHRTSDVYDIHRLKTLIQNVDPDYVLTEIPPDRLQEAAQQFRQTGVITESRVKVFPEYTDAVFPLQKEMGFEIVPCAAWTKAMNDSRRATMTGLKKSHAAEYAEMEQSQQEAGKRIETLGDPNDPSVIHTDQYDEHVRVGMIPYDRHFNELIGDGGWTNINAAHYALIEKALNAHQGEGKTMLITFGSWHKYYIKDQLRKRTDIRLVSMQEYLDNSGTGQQGGGAMNWNQFRMNAAHGGSRGATDISKPALLWEYATGDVIESSPAVYGNMVYTGGHSKDLLAIDRKTGKLKWKCTTGGWIRCSPSVVDGTVYFGSDDNKFYALDAATGKQRWQFALGEGGQQSSPAVLDGMVYFGAFDHFVYALDDASGEQKWKFDAGASMLSSPALDEATLFIGTDAGKVHAISAASGKSIWSIQMSDKPVLSSPAYADGVVFFTSYDHHVYAVDAKTGEPKWKRKTDGPIFSSPAIVDGTVYVGSNDKHLYALDASDGSQKWRSDLGGAVFSSPTVASNSIYVGSSDGHLYAVERDTGEERWKYKVADDVKVWTSAAAVDGQIYFGSHAGSVIVLTEQPTGD